MIEVSVAMAVYHGERFLDEQIQSLLNQTQMPDEIIICDDSKDDLSFKVIEKYNGKTKCQIKYHRNAKPLGVTKNFEKAVSLCQGEFIFLCDQDDVWNKDKIKSMIRSMREHPNYGAAICNGSVVNVDLMPKGYSLWDMLWFKRKEQLKVESKAQLKVFMKHVVASGNTMCFRAKFLDLILPFPKLHSCHDAWIASSIGAVTDFGLVKSDLLKYRIHDENVIGIGKPSLIAQIKMAKKQLRSGAFKYAEDFAETLLCRLESSSYQISEDTYKLIKSKAEHSRIRDRMSSNFFKRILSVSKEFFKGNYSRYSYGIKSVLQDLFLR